MRKLFNFSILALITMAFNANAQWSTSGTSIYPTTTTNNVIIGPVPTTPTNLYVNSTSSNSTTLSIDNNFSPSGPTAFTSGVNFNLLGATKYQIYCNSVPYQTCSGILHIQGTASNSPGIHMSGNTMSFSRSSGIYQCTNPTPYAFDGAVSIGSPTGTQNTSNYNLFVSKGIVTEELVINLQANWSDYVFAKDYKLRPLSEVKSFVEKNSHLPDVPAACEIAEKGVVTGEMLNIHMKKIEELTLYMIQLKEENEALKRQLMEQNEVLNRRIEAIEQK
jgi:hypothetical protein